MNLASEAQKHFLPNLGAAALSPEYAIEFSAWFEHAPFAFWLVENVRPRCFVELGTHTGFSYFCFCQAVKRLHSQTECFAIDTWLGDEHAGKYGEDVFERCQLENKKYDKFSTLIRSTFIDALSNFEDNSIDLIHIDGRHFYEDVYEDFNSWRQKLTPNSIVIFHDTNVYERNFGVWKLFRELKAHYRSFEFLHGYGLGIIAMGDIPAALEKLFSADSGDTHRFQDDFASLGKKILQTWTLAQEISSLKVSLSSETERHGLVVSDLLNTIQSNLADFDHEVNKLQNEAVGEREIHSEIQTKLQNTIQSNVEQFDLVRQQSERLLFEIDKKHQEKNEYLRKKNIFALELIQNARLLKRRFPWFVRIVSKIRQRFAAKSFDVRVVKNCVLFDEIWYLSTYSDVASAKMDAAKHYVRFGAPEGRDPGPHFSTTSYLKANPDVQASGKNALVHFDRFGWWEERQIFSTKQADYLNDLDRARIQQHLGSLANQPLISVVMPAYNSNSEFFRQAIDSVLNQIYLNWELCIANDASPDPHVAKIMEEYAAKDRRIKTIHRETNGNISAASNSALHLASGEFVALMDHDDLLHETALYEIVAEHNAHPDADIIYSDEDKIDENNRRYGPYFKPDFNPELLLGQNYINHLCVYRRSLLAEIGGFREGFEGSQDYDLFLRAWAASNSNKIRHIPAVLYHWRIDSRAKSFSQTQMDRCIIAARKAIQQFLDIEEEGATVDAANMAPQYSRVLRRVRSPAPLVSIIVPTKDRADLLSICADGVLNQTDYPDIEFIVVNHNSVEKKTLDLFAKLQRDPRVTVLNYQGEFNYSAMNNFAAKNAKGEVLALLNNDIEITLSDWLSEMVSYAMREGIGAVGAKLYYPDSRIQHAGVVIGIGGSAAHVFWFQPKTSPGYYGQALLTRAVSAVTGACLVVRKAAFFEVGGLNEIELKVAFNDVDLCLKLQAAGYRNVWTPFAELIHHESASRGSDEAPEKRARFRAEASYLKARWPDIIANDPFYNPNLSLKHSDYRPETKSRRVPPWQSFKIKGGT